MHIWYWQQVLVHFSVILLLSAAVLLVISRKAANKAWAVHCQTTGIWNFWIGMGMGIISVITAAIAYFTLPNVAAETGNTVNGRIVLATITAAIYIALAIWEYIRRKHGEAITSNAWLGLLIFATFMLGLSALGQNFAYERIFEFRFVNTSSAKSY